MIYRLFLMAFVVLFAYPVVSLASEQDVETIVRKIDALYYNIARDFYLSAGAFIGIGDRPTGEHFRSEFGGYSNILFFSFRIYY